MSGTKERESRSGAPGLQQLKHKVTGLAVAGALGGFLFGFDSSVVNGAVDAIGKDFKLSPTLQGFAVALKRGITLADLIAPRRDLRLLLGLGA